MCIENKCKCYSDWKGENCSEASCQSINYCTGNGVCIGKDLCKCDPGWLGDSCSTPDCSLLKSCNKNGICIAPDVCKCDDGFIGSDCSQLIECNDLKNCSQSGICIRDALNTSNECKCFTGFIGRMCESIDCSLVKNCSNNGKCIEPNVCKCDEKYAGQTCSDLSCSSLNFCSKNGVCLPDETCNCFEGWLGFDCSKPDCAKLDNCNNRGVCISPNMCECSTGYDGERCEILIGENKYEPLFVIEQVDLNITDYFRKDSIILVAQAYDNDTGRNGLVNYELISDCFGLVEIDSISGELKLVNALDSFSEDISDCLARIEAYDNGTPRKYSTNLLTVNIKIFKLKNCDDLLISDLNEINLHSQNLNQSIVNLAPNKVANFELRNVSYSFDNENGELLDNLKINEQSGSIYIVKKINPGSYKVIAVALQNIDGNVCEKMVEVKVNVFAVPDSAETSTLISSTMADTSISPSSVETKTSSSSYPTLNSETKTSSSTSSLSSKKETRTTTYTTSTEIKTSSSTSTATETSTPTISSVKNIYIKMRVAKDYLEDFSDIKSEKSVEFINQYKSFV